MKQRLGIAIALVNDPEVVFLDEPTTGLDPRARREVWEVLLGLKQKGKTVFLTTHYMEEAELLADTVAIISKGKIIAIGSPGELTESNANYLVLTLQPVNLVALCCCIEKRCVLSHARRLAAALHIRELPIWSAAARRRLIWRALAQQLLLECGR